MQINNHTFLVAGGGSGLGEACTRRLVEKQGKVIIADVNAMAGQALAEELAPRARFIETDVTDAAGVERAAQAAVDAFGGLHGAVNCAGIPSNLLESELFGHVRGAFTGADRDRKGKLDLAQGGTLLLDEMGDMSLELQAKLLRVLEERVYEPVGSNKTIKADLRIIVATNKNLAHDVKKGNFFASISKHAPTRNIIKTLPQSQITAISSQNRDWDNNVSYRD